jgi:copper(I)-binding protein
MTARFRILIAWTLGAVAASLSAQAIDAKIRIDGAWARRAPIFDTGSSKGNGAVYATLVNPGKEPDALIAATSNAADAVELRQSFQASGKVKVRQVEKIDVPAGERVEMQPGGYHIMLLDLTRELKVGEVVDLTLQFQKAGKIAVAAQVK